MHPSLYGHLETRPPILRMPWMRTIVSTIPQHGFLRETLQGLGNTKEITVIQRGTEKNPLWTFIPPSTGVSPVWKAMWRIQQTRRRTFSLSMHTPWETDLETSKSTGMYSANMTMPRVDLYGTGSISLLRQRLKM